ncbi:MULTISPECIES: ABC transporter ATP-binding protein [unclassified Avibacterium]|uniref:ABC transporter ATP-binding protein n=1 Tax=unclassified Avibacterium TaxID=2685287 RepID=UPI0020271FAD|nr:MULTISPECIES: ABC transporter ATP-binding protein [unclassified Avibacterium]MCW9697957.1 ABC transporter ATP-binding protein [Avibacterium sp. 20-129]URL05714.1 ABC transporter ATP-binding protein [Avibacterium sp. 21-595]
MIKLHNVSLSYGIQNITCHIPQGKLVGIMGGNGAGKSTLLKAIAGILPLETGTILFNEQPLNKMSLIQKSQILAYFAQNTEIYWDLSVYDVIALGLPETMDNLSEKVRSKKSKFFSHWLHSSHQQWQQQKIQQIACQFSVQHLLEQPFQQLSGGEKARVQLARCCIKNAPILLADEPIAPLDPYYQIDILEQLKSLTPSTTCVVAIHHLDLAYRFCDEIILLHQGNLLAHGNTQDALTAENLAIAFGVKAEIDVEKRMFGTIQKL